jgi:hypothetical protein
VNTDELVRADVVAVVHPESECVAVTLSWTTAEPYAVAMCFQVGRTEAADVTWLVSRELLAEGLADRAGAGIGDIRIERGLTGPSDVQVTLTTPTGHTAMWFDAEELAEFLEATTALTPFGDEHRRMDWDDAIASLLDTDRGWWPR